MNKNVGHTFEFRCFHFHCHRQNQTAFTDVCQKMGRSKELTEFDWGAVIAGAPLLQHISNFTF